MLVPSNVWDVLDRDTGRWLLSMSFRPSWARIRDARLVVFNRETGEVDYA